MKHGLIRRALLYTLSMTLLSVGLSAGCAKEVPTSAARVRLENLHVLFSEADSQTSFANIPAAATGRLVVTVPFNTGSGGGWTDADVKRNVSDLRSIENMDYLVLRMTRVTDEGLTNISSISQLRHLHLGMTDVSDKGIASLLALPHLEGLYLDMSDRVTGDSLRSFQNVPLRKLSLRGTSVSDDTMRALGELTKLEHLDLGITGVGDMTLTIVAMLPSLKTLLVDSTRITNDGMRQLLRCRKLSRLVVSKNPQITDDEVSELCKLPQLRSLDLSGTAIEKERIEDLRNAFPHLELVWSFGAK